MTARRDGDIPAEKLARPAAADVRRRELDRGQRVWWKANATHPGAATMLCWSREGDVFPPTLSATGTRMVSGIRCGRRRLGASTTVGVVRTGLRQGSSNRRSNS